MQKLRLPAPSEKQKEFLTDTHKYLAFGGARGGGKSFAVRMDAVLKALKYPGIKLIIVRKTLNELMENHIRPLCEWLGCYSDEPIARMNMSRKTMSFVNGSIILFRYCGTDADADRFQGTECDVLYVDEATQQPEERIRKLTACVRGVNSFPKLIRFTCNPGGVGHSWVKRLFIDRAFTTGENAEDYGFIQSSVYDNKALMAKDPEYVKQLEALPPKLRDMWLYGRWNIFSGQFFEEFRARPDMMLAREAHCSDSEEELYSAGRFTHVIEPLDMNFGERKYWRIYRSYDFGYGRPFSCGWWAVDSNGVLYRIKELYGCSGTPDEGLKWTPDRQFEKIAQIERDDPMLAGKRIEGVADPSIWDGSRGQSIADTAMKYGLFFSPGDNKRVPGWMQCRYRLQFDKNGYPGMYVFSTCRDFIRTIPLLTFNRMDPEDLDTDLEDHAADDWRYFCMFRPVRTEITAPAKLPDIYGDPLKRR